MKGGQGDQFVANGPFCQAGDLDWSLKVMRSQGMSSREHDLLSCVLPVLNQRTVVGLCHRRASF